MATPTDPTATTIVTEAWNMAGIASPTSAQLTRATDQWLQEVFNEIWLVSGQMTGGGQLKTLQETLIDVSVKGTRTLALTEDFDEELTVEILDGAHRGTAQAGGATTITFASDEDATEADVLGRWILVTGGTGENGFRQCTAYDTGTKVATVSAAWDTNPAISSTYLVVNKVHSLDEEHYRDLAERTSEPLPGRPTSFAKYERDLIFDKPFDVSTYGIRLRYYVKPNQVDLVTGSTTTITRIYRNWQSVLKKGVQYKAEMSVADANWVKTKQDFEAQLARLMNKEIPTGGEFVGFTL